MSDVKAWNEAWKSELGLFYSVAEIVREVCQKSLGQEQPGVDIARSPGTSWHSHPEVETLLGERLVEQSGSSPSKGFIYKWAELADKRG